MANSEAGYVTIHVTKFPHGLRHTGCDGMASKTKAKGFGADLVESMKLVLAHQQGTVKLEQVWPKPIDVKAIRKRVKMSQAEFFLANTASASVHCRNGSRAVGSQIRLREPI
jgi:hypothetical protein